MKTTFLHNFSHQLSEIFHPRDFRKVTGHKCLFRTWVSPENDSTENLPTDLSEGRIQEEISTDEYNNTPNTPSSDYLSLSNLKENPNYGESNSSEPPLLSKEENLPCQPSELTSTQEIYTSSYNHNIESKTTTKNEERELLLQRILIKVLIIIVLGLITLMLAPKSKANDRLSLVSLSAGVVFPNGLDLTAQYELTTSYHNAWAVELEGYLRWRTCPDCNSVCRKSFWDNYRSYHIGILYKPCVARSRNQHGRLRIGGSIGYDHHKVIPGVLLGYEHTYCLTHGWELFWSAKADVQILAKNWVRPGVSVGVRLPL